MTKKAPAVRPGGSINFPSFCLDRPAAARRQLPALARAWASRYESSGEFPPFEVLPVSVGSLVFVNASADLNEGRTGSRLYLVFALLDAIQKARGWQDSEQVRDAFERALRRLRAGALTFGLDARAPDSRVKLRLRVDGLVANWTDFERFEYVDATVEPILFATVVERRFHGLLTMWRDDGGGDLRRDLPIALAAAENATPATRTERAVALLRDVASTNARIRNKEKLRDSGLLRDALAALVPDEREAIELGSMTAVLTFLYGADRTLA